MSRGYTVLWTNDRCKYLKRCGEEGKPLVVTFGEIHLSAPSFMKAKVTAGDFIYPIGGSTNEILDENQSRVCFGKRTFFFLKFRLRESHILFIN